jgi:hypothetical protein
MFKRRTEPLRLSWRLPSWVATVEFAVFLPIAMIHPDAWFFLGLFIVIPLLLAASLVVLFLLIRAAIGYGRLHPLAVLATLGILWAFPTSLVFFERAHPFALHETARWLAWSRGYKQKVLAQALPPGGGFQSMEWDGAGLAGIANQDVVLVFDPSNALAAAAKSPQPGRISGIACDLRYVHRLESRWYYVVYFDDECDSSR